jgi:hypothetical protein
MRNKKDAARLNGNLPGNDIGISAPLPGRLRMLVVAQEDERRR